MNTRLVNKLVEFECNASVLADALNLGTEEVLFLPHNNHLMMTNIGGVYTTFKVMTKETFFSYDMKLEILDEWLENEDVENLKPIVIAVSGMVKLLRKIQGRALISIEEPKEGEVRYIHVKDLIGGEESFEGKFTMKERTIVANRLLTRYIQFFDEENLMLPKVALFGGDFHLLKIKEGLEFSPLILSAKEYKQFVTSVISLNPDEFEVRVFNSSSEEEFTANYIYTFLESTNESKFQEATDHSKTFYNFPANPQTMELVLKYQSAKPQYISIIEVEDDIAPFYVFFSSLKDMGNAGKIYTSSLLFLEGDIDEKDIKVDVVE